jgi:hypothetical protein
MTMFLSQFVSIVFSSYTYVSHQLFDLVTAICDDVSEVDFDTTYKHFSKQNSKVLGVDNNRLRHSDTRMSSRLRQ